MSPNADGGRAGSVVASPLKEVASSTLKQGDLGLLGTEQAQALLTSRVPARVAYVAADGTPRVFPTHFVWDGHEVVMGTYAGAFKIAALRARPVVAITIDTEGFPPTVLPLRGPASVTDVDGIVPEYAAAMRRCVGDETADELRAEADEPGLRMARIAVRPTWVGLLDFQRRLPAAVGGIRP
ncbi:pyridoxamine 5'-phosphate oxidase family protein [Georgenia sp. TF02-10]|uniref:pyridoxamine 5'-phosphate oxidase family protein n=1 Tax=Georgenia sp. TF02-10 TaxID=2917725 RepID=UPI001FA725E5|nr:pyridoxamine 5'-phosphate oxidase family protein [Georgenia sp. TF02-10]UNX55629.1 pyridoxamine 5'-phosphate oxidase family protein [Georgenia sp. TF02-10]